MPNFEMPQSQPTVAPQEELSEVDRLKERLGKSLDPDVLNNIEHIMSKKQVEDELNKRGISLPELKMGSEDHNAEASYRGALTVSLVRAMEEEQFGPKPETGKRKGGSRAGSFVKDSKGEWQKI